MDRWRRRGGIIQEGVDVFKPDEHGGGGVALAPSPARCNDSIFDREASLERQEFRPYSAQTQSLIHPISRRYFALCFSG